MLRCPVEVLPRLAAKGLLKPLGTKRLRQNCSKYYLPKDVFDLADDRVKMSLITEEIYAFRQRKNGTEDRP